MSQLLTTLDSFLEQLKSLPTDERAGDADDPHDPTWGLVEDLINHIVLLRLYLNISPQSFTDPEIRAVFVQAVQRAPGATLAEMISLELRNRGAN
jgi:hypothetical protein